MGLDTFPHLRDRPLRRDAQDLRQCKARRALDYRRDTYGECDPCEQVITLLADNFVAQILCRGRQHHAGET